MFEFSKEFSVTTTSIPGLLIIDLPVYGDSRGWFKENWHQEKLLRFGLPDLGPVQNNISFNKEIGTTRGIHAEPWDKYISVATGKIFGAWVDLREGNTFGNVFTCNIDPSQAVYIPRGVANSYQTLEKDTSYVYLVNDHWNPTDSYTYVNLADENLDIKWPIPLTQAEISDKDLLHPRLIDVSPIKPKKAIIFGANGQVGKALKKQFPQAHFVAREECDLTDPDSFNQFDWAEYAIVINAAAYTSVDQAETKPGRKLAWETNVQGLTKLVTICRINKLTLVHISSDYVFDGTNNQPYTEEDSLCPLGVYGQTKAAGEQIVATLPKHYILRTSWVIGEGNNFVKKMKSLAHQGISPEVVNDQIGKLSFADDIARAISHLLDKQVPYGTYNFANSGEPASWADVSKLIFGLIGRNPLDVTPVTTHQYNKKNKNIAPRPKWSVLNTSKLEATKFDIPDWRKRLSDFVQGIVMN